MDDLIKIAKKRMATKKYSQKLVDEKLMAKVHKNIISNSEVSKNKFTRPILIKKDKLTEVAQYFAVPNRSKINECSGLVLIVTKFDKNIKIDDYLKSSYIEDKDQAKMEWRIKYAYLLLGVSMLNFIKEGIDTTPMEGYSYDDLRNYAINNNLIEEDEFISVALSFGYRSSDHFKSKHVRIPASEKMINPTYEKLSDNVKSFIELANTAPSSVSVEAYNYFYINDSKNLKELVSTLPKNAKLNSYKNCIVYLTKEAKYIKEKNNFILTRLKRVINEKIDNKIKRISLGKMLVAYAKSDKMINYVSSKMFENKSQSKTAWLINQSFISNGMFLEGLKHKKIKFDLVSNYKNELVLEKLNSIKKINGEDNIVSSLIFF